MNKNQCSLIKKPLTYKHKGEGLGIRKQDVTMVAASLLPDRFSIYFLINWFAYLLIYLLISKTKLYS